MASAPPPPDPLVGRVLAGHYRLVARLGTGASGAVYRAEHTLLDHAFAVKVLDAETSADPEVRRRFLVEARSLALFAHENAVQVRHCGEEDGLLFLAMDLCPGETLASLLAREAPLAPARAVGIVAQALDALDAAHRAGIVHRDFKPANVMVETTVGPDGAPVDRVRVVDFGLAHVVAGGPRALPPALASTGGAVVGTVAYMAPEQLRAEDEVDGRADVFAAAVVLAECLTGRLPFDGRSAMSIALRILEQPPEPWPTAVAAAAPQALRPVLERALEKDRARRWPDAAAFSAALRRAAAGAAPSSPTSARAPSTERAPRSARPRRTLTRRRALVAGAVVLALALAAVVAATTRHEPASARHRARAASALAQGRWSDAVDAVGLVIASGDADGDDHLLRATARTELADANAKGDLDEARRRLPGDPRVATAQGRFHWLVEHDAKAADEAFQRALLLDRGHLDAWEARARCALDRGDLEGAEADARAIEAAAPRDVRGPLLRARASMRRVSGADDASQTAIGKAVAAARAAAALDPEDAEVALVLVSALASRAHVEQTARRHAEATATRAEAAREAERAVALVERAPSHRRQGALLVAALQSRASQRFAAGDAAGALEDARRVLALRPGDPGAFDAAEFIRQQSGDAESIEAYRWVYEVTRNPDHWFRHGFGHQQVGAAALDRGDVAEAAAAFDRAAAVYAQGRERHPDAVDFWRYGAEVTAARARLEHGDARERGLAAALALADAAVTRRADDGESLLRRAEIRLAAGRPREALRDATDALARTPIRTPRYDQVVALATLAALDAGPEATADAGGPQAALERGVRAAGDAWADLVASDATRALAPRMLVLRAALHARGARLAPDATTRAAAVAAAQADLRAVEEAAAAAGDDEATRLRAGAALRRAELLLAQAAGSAGVERDAFVRDAGASAKQAIERREAAQAAGRWGLDGAWYDVLAAALDAAGDADGAAAARRSGATLPR
ncbi:MAG: serine/threonine protein kinase [Planctomycetes bacterium]|nr:serine/threonine protein kinase [Planctomycetota bacterium]